MDESNLPYSTRVELYQDFRRSQTRDLRNRKKQLRLCIEHGCVIETDGGVRCRMHQKKATEFLREKQYASQKVRFTAQSLEYSRDKRGVYSRYLVTDRETGISREIVAYGHNQHERKAAAIAAFQNVSDTTQKG